MTRSARYTDVLPLYTADQRPVLIQHRQLLSYSAVGSHSGSQSIRQVELLSDLFQSVIEDFAVVARRFREALYEELIEFSLVRPAGEVFFQ